MLYDRRAKLGETHSEVKTDIKAGSKSYVTVSERTVPGRMANLKKIGLSSLKWKSRQPDSCVISFILNIW